MRRSFLNITIPEPTINSVELLLLRWKGLENYVYQESSLNKLFLITYPQNTDLDDVLIKVCSLNDFYSTQIFSPYNIANHIINLNIDRRLRKNDITLVNDIALITIKGKKYNFYSFASKYCSHHNQVVYPIYDNYVKKMLLYFRDKYEFSEFEEEDLKQYNKYKLIVHDFIDYYKLNSFSLKDIDKYLWLTGKDHFQVIKKKIKKAPLVEL